MSRSTHRQVLAVLVVAVALFSLPLVASAAPLIDSRASGAPFFAQAIEAGHAIWTSIADGFGRVVGAVGSSLDPTGVAADGNVPVSTDTGTTALSGTSSPISAPTIGSDTSTP